MLCNPKLANTNPCDVASNVQTQYKCIPQDEAKNLTKVPPMETPKPNMSETSQGSPANGTTVSLPFIPPYEGVNVTDVEVKAQVVPYSSEPGRNESKVLIDLVGDKYSFSQNEDKKSLELTSREYASLPYIPVYNSTVKKTPDASSPPVLSDPPAPYQVVHLDIPALDVLNTINGTNSTMVVPGRCFSNSNQYLSHSVEKLRRQHLKYMVYQPARQPASTNRPDMSQFADSIISAANYLKQAITGLPQSAPQRALQTPCKPFGFSNLVNYMKDLILSPKPYFNSTAIAQANGNATMNPNVVEAIQTYEKRGTLGKVPQEKGTDMSKVI
jgi:hypothetical protein